MAVTQAELQQLYVGYFGRPADYDGVIWYTNQPDITIWDVANSFSQSPESQRLYGTTVNAAMINAIYRNLFNRDAENEGLDYWLGEVAKGNLTPGGVALAILLGAQNEDKVTIENKLAIAESFTNGLDTTAERIGYSGDAAASAARAFLAKVSDDPATVADAQAGLDAAINGGTNGGVEGQTFTLTTGVDNVVGTSGNDTILGSNDVNGTGNITFNIGDIINGGAGTDTLVVANDASTLTLSAKTVTNVEHFKVVNGYEYFDTLNVNQKAFQTVTVDYAGTAQYDDLDIDGINGNTDLVVENVIAGGYGIERNDAGVYSTLTGSVTQNNTLRNIDYSVNDYYIWFVNSSYFSAATELNLTTTVENVITGGDGNTGSDEGVYLYDYIDLTADKATVNLTYNLKDVEQPGYYTEIDAYVENEAAIANADVVNVEVNVDNVDGLYVYIDTNNSGVSSANDTFTLNVAAGGLANTDGSNGLDIDEFETVNLTIDGNADIEWIDAYSNVAAAQTINIVANADLTVGLLDEADTQEVTVNISGAGNVTIAFNGDNEGFTLNGGTATGNLELEVGSDSGYATVVTTGSGDDGVALLNAFELNADGDAFLQVLDGGAGIDTFEIDTDDLVASQALLGSTADAPEDFSGAIKNFERLSLTSFGTQAIDATTLGFNDVTIDGYTTGGSLTMEDGAKVTVTGYGSTDLAIIIDGAATGNQSVSLTVAAQETTDASDEGLVLAGLDISDVEAISIASTSADDATEVADGIENDINAVELIAAAATTITISGDTALDLGGTLTKVKTVDAADFDAGLTIDLSTSTVAMTVTVGDGDNEIIGGAKADTITTGAGYDVINAGAGDDVISTGNGGSEITAGAGKDTINLGSGATAADVDKIIYTAVGDSQGVTVDVINGFQVDVQATTDTNADGIVDATDLINDVIDLSGITFTGTASYKGEAAGYGAVLTSLQGGGTNAYAVLDTTTSILYIDVNADGALTDADMAIQLTGVTELSAANFFFAAAPV